MILRRHAELPTTFATPRNFVFRVRRRSGSSPTYSVQARSIAAPRAQPKRAKPAQGGLDRLRHVTVELLSQNYFYALGLPGVSGLAFSIIVITVFSSSVVSFERSGFVSLAASFRARSSGFSVH